METGCGCQTLTTRPPAGLRQLRRWSLGKADTNSFMKLPKQVTVHCWRSASGSSVYPGTHKPLRGNTVWNYLFPNLPTKIHRYFRYVIAQCLLGLDLPRIYNGYVVTCSPLYDASLSLLQEIPGGLCMEGDTTRSNSLDSVGESCCNFGTDTSFVQQVRYT
jgi:hypothetical protein